MAGELYRAFVPDLEIRKASQGGDGRTIVGISVPYGRPQQIGPDLREQFARGSSNHLMRAPNRMKFTRGHLVHGGTLIGRAVELRDDAAGLWGAWRVSATEAGDETLTLVEDGALDELSVGFRARQNRRLDDGTIERVKVDIFETAVVEQGAYGRGAVITGVREHGDDVDMGGASYVCPACGVDRVRAAEAAQVTASMVPVPAGP